ncbi:hypothetical protein [Sutcliffiella sp. NC1]|uniref:hypothetical protein n=1 Tax=Sutcliffiella sp. NC1 TaxID=3004096 RepID=UPI0022DD41AD|nr:hypothetical protein [Sutcliffiella sp. NC1]WBL16382.1 hypothetical protein O1A01_07045 [Sutcliffiella sp. NC1]
MDLNFLLPFMALIGVIVGFILNWFKEFIQNKPRIKVSLNDSGGKFNYYKTVKNNIGGVWHERSIPEEARFLKLYNLINVYNIGKLSSGIKGVDVEVCVNDYCRYFTPELKIDGKVNKDFTFNVPTGSICTLEINLEIKKDENTQFLFNEDVIIDVDSKNRLIFILILTDIYNKKHKVTIEPLAFATAE